jgi:hypothetical protein
MEEEECSEAGRYMSRREKGNDGREGQEGGD